MLHAGLPSLKQLGASRYGFIPRKEIGEMEVA